MAVESVPGQVVDMFDVPGRGLIVHVVPPGRDDLDKLAKDGKAKRSEATSTTSEPHKTIRYEIENRSDLPADVKSASYIPLEDDFPMSKLD